MKPIHFAKPDIREEDIKVVAQVLRSGRLTDGPQVAQLEEVFACEIGGRGAQAVAVSSCWAALVLLYKASFFQEDMLLDRWWKRNGLIFPLGSEVICPAMSHVATALAIEVSGARPVFVDCELQTGNMDPEGVIQALSRYTVALAPMYYCGNPYRLDVLQEIAEQKQLLVIEDCATALGAQGLRGGPGGGAAFSFYPSKHIGIGEGGMVLTWNANVFREVKKLRAFGLTKTGEFPSDMTSGEGGNYRLTEMQAALALAQLRRLPENLAHRRQIAHLLIPQLQELGFTPLVSPHAREQSAFLCLSALLPDVLGNRNEFVRKMRERGIELSVYYPLVIPATSYFRRKYGDVSGQFPCAERIAARAVAFPVGPHIGEEEVAEMVGAVKEML